MAPTQVPEHVRARSGLCECGCGGLTKIATKTHAAQHTYAGYPLRFLPAHQPKPGRNRRSVRYVVEDRGYVTPCWVWQIGINPRWGYGYDSRNGKRVRAHRAMWEDRHGPVPDGCDLDHLCRVRACVNPDHLEPVTRVVNLRRGARTKLKSADLFAMALVALTTDLSQLAIADLAGVTGSTVNKIVNGRNARLQELLGL